MLPIKVAILSGYTGARSNMFSGAASDAFSLGRTGQEWYLEAKEEVAEFDDLMNRTRKIANKPVREEIAATYYGNPADENSGSYSRNAVASDIGQAEAYTPVAGDLVFGVSRRQNRISNLKAWNANFKEAVMAAEAQWGSLPAPEVIERMTTVSSTPGWVAPVVVGALGIAALAALGVFGGGR